MQILVVKVSFLFSHAHLLSINMVTEVLPILVVISSLRERSLVVMAPKYMKEFMTSKGVPLIMTFGRLSTSWPMTLVFLCWLHGQILCRHVRTCWVAPEAHLQCGLPMQHHLERVAHGSGLFWLLSLLLILPNWTVFHLIWCAAKHLLGSLGRHTVGVWKEDSKQCRC